MTLEDDVFDHCCIERVMKSKSIYGTELVRNIFKDHLVQTDDVLKENER